MKHKFKYNAIGYMTSSKTTCNGAQLKRHMPACQDTDFPDCYSYLSTDSDLVPSNPSLLVCGCKQIPSTASMLGCDGHANAESAATQTDVLPS